MPTGSISRCGISILCTADTEPAVVGNAELSRGATTVKQNRGNRTTVPGSRKLVESNLNVYELSSAWNASNCPLYPSRRTCSIGRLDKQTRAPIGRPGSCKTTGCGGNMDAETTVKHSVLTGSTVPPSKSTRTRLGYAVVSTNAPFGHSRALPIFPLKSGLLTPPKITQVPSATTLPAVV